LTVELLSLISATPLFPAVQRRFGGGVVGSADAGMIFSLRTAVVHAGRVINNILYYRRILKL
jgi:hypothetical protein